VLHIFNHALMKGALFLALGCVVLRVGGATIVSVRGLGREMPWTMGAFVGGGLSLIGVPLTVGFVSKWYLILAALEVGWWPVAIAVVASSLLAVVYVWRVVEAAYFQDAPEGRAPVAEAPLAMLVPVWVLVLANIYFGIDTELSVSAARLAAETLVGGWR
jgi:multicomponent Na+:H+ antiporter subunit D